MEKNTVEYGGHEWFLYITRNVSFWANCLVVKGNAVNFVDFGIPISFPILIVCLGGTQSYHFSYEPAYSECSNLILKSALGEEKLSKIEMCYESLGRKLLQALDKCKQNVTADNWIDFTTEYARYTAGLNLTAILGRVGAEALKEKLTTLGVAADKIPEINSIITYPAQHTPLFLSQNELYQIAARSQAGKLNEQECDQELEQWLAKNNHIPVNFTSEPWTMADAKDQLTGILKKEAQREIDRFNQDHAERVKRAQETLAIFNDEELSELATTIARATYLNEYRKDIFSRVSLGFRPIFQKIAELGGAKTWRDCFFLTPDEMTGILRGVSIDINQKVKERQVVVVRSKTEQELDILNEQDTKRFAEHIGALRGDGVSADKNEIIKGYSANKGIVRGRVKIVLSREDFHKLNPGDILVAMATSVDYVPIMERAAAFVTNEGGITSHASIVSREMNKPCIIGTKIATRVLKDGMEVEVDANQGVVRILN